MKALILMTFLFLFTFPATSYASGMATAESSLFDYQQTHYSSLFKINTTVGAGVQDKTVNGTISFDIGRGAISEDVGIGFLNTPLIDHVNGSQLALVSYVGVPLLIRANYVERKNASFSLKAGVMPAYIVNLQNNFDLDHSEIFELFGFTGSTPLSDSIDLLIDFTYIQGTANIDSFGTRIRAFLLSAGLRFDL